MELKVNLVQENSHQVVLQDVSDVASGVSRVILDFQSPIKKRIELNGTTEVKPFNFVNPLVDTLLTLSDTMFGSTCGFTPDIYEVDYSVHYPFRQELFVTVDDNQLWGISMLDVLGDSNWLYFNEEYYQVIKPYSTQDYLFLDRPVEKLATVAELAYRDKIYLPLLEKYRSLMDYKFRNLSGNTANVTELETISNASFVLLGIIDNVAHGSIDAAKEQLIYVKKLLQWDLEKQLPDCLPD